MKRWTNYFVLFYKKIFNSIAFYPAMLAIVFLLFSILIIQIEYSPFLMDIKEELSISLVHDAENGRLVLGTIVASIISLMVFSFSMVMVVLNRATATLSPRVLPGLISNRFHQIVLGFFLGTVIYSLLMIVNINSPQQNFHVPSFGILISMILAIICLVFFVSFIHSISQKIQVDNIMNDIKESTRKALKKANIEEGNQSEKKEETEPISPPKDEGWYSQKAYASGFLKHIKLNSLKDFCNKNKIIVKLEISVGTYLVKHYPYVKTNKRLNDEQKKELASYFILYTEEHITDHYSFGFQQISEIAIKALSPGINDPGTAIRAIDLLSDLFIQLMMVKQQLVLRDENANICVYLKPITFKATLYQTFVPIRKYGQQDVLVLMHLLSSLEKMLYVDDEKKLYYDEIHEFAQNVIECSAEFYDNKLDKEQLNKIILKINQQFSGKQKLKFI
ncbi:DUF2254 domain-containing protein [Marivirga sp. S37H4]|uniref:DUF2254 domain-containing protein n=1 Tax=Marivirga aurantiaca TaxID=2802615 RepID=A0A934WYY3_9BACT|nr:DUF2254 domain-containing protein [Marivirga aurantiaca]MBK6265754.1 DUF2254 domain-containing protein [Marivirga aurantiaca]